GNSLEAAGLSYPWGGRRCGAGADERARRRGAEKGGGGRRTAYLAGCGAYDRAGRAGGGQRVSGRAGVAGLNPYVVLSRDKDTTSASQGCHKRLSIRVMVSSDSYPGSLR